MIKRSKKVAELLKSEISSILKFQVKDPEIGFTTLVDVSLSEDLRNAKIYFSVLGDRQEGEKTLKALTRASSFIQAELGTRLRLRYVPVLHFYLDRSWEYREKIDLLLDSLKDETPVQKP
ncbi:MAG TPA: 30S ribosome-binding factor RbfA [bacterium]|nr:30S ribosome-binding factor RbfA [bacterium]